MISFRVHELVLTQLRLCQVEEIYGDELNLTNLETLICFLAYEGGEKHYGMEEEQKHLIVPGISSTGLHYLVCR